MALTVEVTKTSVVETDVDRWTVTGTLVLKDNGTPVLTHSLSTTLKAGKNPADLAPALISQGQEVIDKYNNQKSKYDTLLMDNLMTSVQKGLVV